MNFAKPSENRAPLELRGLLTALIVFCGLRLAKPIASCA